MACTLKWTKRGRKLVSADKRVTISKSKKLGYHIVDLDTYNEVTTRTLAAAKRAACGLIKRGR